MTPDSFEAAFAKWHGPIRGWVYTATSDLDLSQTIAAETFLHAWRGWDHFEGEPHSRTAWIWRIARHLLYDNHRRIRRHRHISFVDLDACWNVATPYDELGAIDRRIDVEAAWARLTEHQRDALALVALGYDDAGGGAAMDLPRDAFRSVVFRGRRMLERLTV